MLTWTALIIIQTTMASPVINWPDATQSVGIQSNVYTNVPNLSTLAFSNQELCEKAKEQLGKQDGVLSVSCVQTGE